MPTSTYASKVLAAGIVACAGFIVLTMAPAQQPDERFKAQQQPAPKSSKAAAVSVKAVAVNAPQAMAIAMNMPENPHDIAKKKQTALRSRRPDPDAKAALRPQVPRHTQPVLQARAIAPPRWNEALVPQATPQAEATIKIEAIRLGDEATGRITGTVGEPTAAMTPRGETLYTGNWFAAFGKSPQDLRFVNPAQIFPESGGHQFCCDQVALYDETNDLMIWFLQYTENAVSNIVRVAVAKGADIANQRWRYYDFSPKSLGGWQQEWLDFPELALSKDFLYITSNAFSTADNSPRRAVIFRLRLKTLADYGEVTADVFDSTESFSLRPTQGAREGVMYFGGHYYAEYGNKIEVYSWADADAQPRRDTFAIEWWNAAIDRAYESRNRNGIPWLERADARMTAAWAAGRQIGFAWAVDRDSAHDQPHVRVAVLDVDTAGGVPGRPTRVAAQPHLYNNRFAYAYPAAGVTKSKRVGLVVSYGGGDEFDPSVAAGFLTTEGGQMVWKLRRAVDGKGAPAAAEGRPAGLWGDYASVRPDPSRDNALIATGYVLEGGNTHEFIRPYLLRFATDGSPPTPPVPGLQGLRDDVRQIRNDAAEVSQQLEKLRKRLEDLDKKVQGASQAAPASGGAPAAEPPPKEASK